MSNLREWLTHIASLNDRPGFEYSSMEEFILRNGREWKGARRNGFRKLQNKMCYSNCWRRITQGYELDYAEGYAIGTAGFPMLHAWLVDPTDDHVVETTWRGPLGDHEYFGIVIPQAVVCRHLFKNGVYGVLGNDWMGDSAILRGLDTLEDE